MNVTAILRDENAVSAVVGVALMIAITVVLASVVGAFVLTTDVQEPAPDTDWTTSEKLASGDVDTVTFLHAGGDTVQGDQLNVVYTGSAPTSNTIPSSQVTAGDSFEVEFTSSAADEGEVVRIVWSADGSDQTEILHEHTLTSDVTN